MFQQVTPRSFLWLVILCAVLIIEITGCGGDDNETDDDNEWGGTWSLETFDGQTLEQVMEKELGDRGSNYFHCYQQLDI